MEEVAVGAHPVEDELGGDLLHTYRAGTARVDAFLRDYAFLLQAAVDLYEATFKPTWIDRAESLA
ncbi:MAG: hypothetical protein R6V58_00565, partial [Planctomycetota bacterium]